MMLSLPGDPLDILCLGAHPDDIEIGCGATLLTLLRERHQVSVTWIVLSGDDIREAEARDGGTRILEGAAFSDIKVAQFRDAYFPYEGVQLKEYFDGLGSQIEPDVIFTHHRGDLHQDHRLVAELTWNTFRNHLILEYEIPKYDADLGSPEMFVPIDEATLQQKIGILMECYPSQAAKPWFTPDVFRAVSVLRGIESRSGTGLAEGFHVRKATLDL